MDGNLKNILSYDKDAYDFVCEAVNIAIKNLKEQRHLSAVEILESCKKLAEKNFGILSENVLNEWGIFSSSDIGNIVFALIARNIFSASKDDRLEDFSINYKLFHVEQKEKISARILHDPIILD